MFVTRVLLVDDEEDFTEILSERLKTRGFQVSVCSNGADAISVTKEKPFDAVILDLSMPGMDGIETLKNMLKNNSDLQVFLLTGRGTIEKSVEAMKSGAVEFIEKPPKIDELVAKIKEAKTVSNKISEQKTMDTLFSIIKKKGW